MNNDFSSTRRLGQSDLEISTVALGCWPMAGITSGPMSDETAVAVIHAALDAGINHLDTAYVYGRSGESERRIAQALRGRRDAVVLGTKVGVYWGDDGNTRRTGRPDVLRRHFEASLRRLEVDHVDLLYLHAAATDTPIAETAGLFRQLQVEGKARVIGVSNLSLAQLEAFHSECRFEACQMRYSFLERGIEADDVLPWCCQHQVGVVAYEPLAKGLLTGKFARETVFDPDDWRSRSPLVAPERWPMTLEKIEHLRPIADRLNSSLAQVAVGWAISQPGVTAALCGAKRPGQIRETAQAMRLAGKVEEQES
jgi:aryl-alcohol dehydrogenase-like predicted oxidoreductase